MGGRNGLAGRMANAAVLRRGLVGRSIVSIGAGEPGMKFVEEEGRYPSLAKATFPIAAATSAR
jgi:hypothetical protein